MVPVLLPDIILLLATRHIPSDPPIVSRLATVGGGCLAPFSSSCFGLAFYSFTIYPFEQSELAEDDVALMGGW